ncbi:hypothetical protein Ga0074812_1242 [Parafrankia irregularis]|uniref:MarR family protein n=1 Tax=Parafrankia irregularis TaxID=795642 RepID=A0A0S4QTQ1_9ACTN|nr:MULTISPECIES: hypothetical protein [Parafrankia]MBE3203779.1 hypothetical protein [Parafrankia sp. CH37]CUU58977.1 hypothetical protein Ga0074812_1242 [Parafrankia irregularis]
MATADADADADAVAVAAAAHGQISRTEAANLCALSSSQASRLLREMARDEGPLLATGAGRATAYTRRPWAPGPELAARLGRGRVRD